MHDEIGPEAVLLVVDTRSGAHPDWHLIDTVNALTWCGMRIGYASQRQLWSDTPAGDRCQECLRSIVSPKLT